MFIRTLWFRRYGLRVEDKPFPLTDIILMARQIQTDFLRVNLGTSLTSSVVQKDCVCWSPPISPMVKVNFDGAVFKDLGEVGIGFVVHDSQGLVLASMSEKVLLPQSVTDVEAKVAVRAINFA